MGLMYTVAHCECCLKGAVGEILNAQCVCSRQDPRSEALGAGHSLSAVTSLQPLVGWAAAILWEGGQVPGSRVKSIIWAWSSSSGSRAGAGEGVPGTWDVLWALSGVSRWDTEPGALVSLKHFPCSPTVQQCLSRAPAPAAFPPFCLW